MNPVAFTIFGKEIYWYAIIIVCGILLGMTVSAGIAKKKGYSIDLILDFLILAIPLGVIGARLYYVAFEWENYASDPIKILYIWNGGLAIFGAVIGGLIAALIFCKWKKVPLGDMLDIAAPAIILAQAIGRWGNFVNQEAFGAQVLNAQYQWFPLAVFIDRLGGWYMATFFYESMWNLVAFAALMFYIRKKRERGNSFVFYLMFYSIGRLFIEGLRTDSLYLIRWGDPSNVYSGIVFDGIRISQALSLLLIIFAVVYFIIRKKHPLAEVRYEGIYTLDYALEMRNKKAAEKAERLAVKQAAISVKAEDKQQTAESAKKDEEAKPEKKKKIKKTGEEKTENA